MDKSKEYIEMCRKATELQELWKPEIGDYCVCPIHSDELPIEILTHDGRQPILQNVLPPQITYVWLPRQDQLQEMVVDACQCRMDWMHKGTELNNFTNWCCCYFDKQQCDYASEHNWEKNIPNFCRSWEQYWLVFVMLTKYKKVWNITEWETCKYEVKL